MSDGRSRNTAALRQRNRAGGEVKVQNVVLWSLSRSAQPSRVSLSLSAEAQHREQGLCPRCPLRTPGLRAHGPDLGEACALLSGNSAAT